MIKSDLFLVCFTVILLMFETYFVFWGFFNHCSPFTDHRCVLAKLPGGLLCGPVAHTASKLLPGHHTSYYGGCHRWAKRQRLLRFQPAGELKVIILSTKVTIFKYPRFEMICCFPILLNVVLTFKEQKPSGARYQHTPICDHTEYLFLNIGDYWRNNNSCGYKIKMCVNVLWKML